MSAIATSNTKFAWKLLHHSEAGQTVGSWTEASAVDPGMRVVPGRARPSELTKRSPEGVTRFSGHGAPLTSKVLDMSVNSYSRCSDMEQVMLPIGVR